MREGLVIVDCIHAALRSRGFFAAWYGAKILLCSAFYCLFLNNWRCWISCHCLSLSSNSQLVRSILFLYHSAVLCCISMVVKQKTNKYLKMAVIGLRKKEAQALWVLKTQIALSLRYKIRSLHSIAPWSFRNIDASMQVSVSQIFNLCVPRYHSASSPFVFSIVLDNNTNNWNTL